MKKLFAVLFCTLVMPVLSFAQEPFYDLMDPVATANAPWKVGEKIIKEGDSYEGEKYYREFLGMTPSGLALVQDFYLSGEKFSDPFLIAVANAEDNMKNSFKNGIEGRYTAWYKNGQKMGEATIKNGKPEGVLIGWHGNGQKAMEEHYKDGEAEGLMTAWYESGQKQGEINYKNGAIEGVWTVWYENGQKKEESHWKDSDFDGLLTNWDENGQKRNECNLKGMQPFGVCRVWDEQGNLVEEKNYGTPKD